MALPRTAALCLAGLAVFSLVFSLLAECGLWPGLPPGALRDSDLVAGFAGGFLLLLLLAPRGNEGTRL